MSTLVLTSASGAPGVTTTALGLTLQWPRESVLLDADRAASQAVLAGYLAGQSPHGLGLQALLHAQRERRDLAEAFAANRLPLPRTPGNGPDGEPPPRWFVPGFTHLGSIDHMEALWTPLLEAQRDSVADLIIDAGRQGHRGLPGALLGGADAVALVCRTSLVSLAALALHLPQLLDAAPVGQAGLILVGPGRPYGAREVSEQFGVPVLAEIPWEPRQAGDLAEGVPLARNWPRQALARAYARTAGDLRELMTAGLDATAGPLA